MEFGGGMATELTKKLQIKPGVRLAIVNPPKDYLAFLAAELPDMLQDHAPEASPQGILAFAYSLEEAKQLFYQAVSALSQEGLVWIAYPKGPSGLVTDINRDRLWKALEFSGWRPVRQIAIDDNWSAMRFRPVDQVGQ